MRLSKEVLIKKISNLLNLYNLNDTIIKSYLMKETLDTLENMTWYSKEEFKQYIKEKYEN